MPWLFSGSFFEEKVMCLICVEYNKKRMTRDEMKKALPEMVMFAKNEEERSHYKKLQSLSSEAELDEEVKKHAALFENEHKTALKTRRS